jgi:heptosyltransferase-2/heptosyltransferase-3
MGDMVMLTPLLSQLHQRYGLPCQVIGTGSWSANIYDGHPDVQGVWSFHRHLPFLFERDWRSVRAALRASHPGPIYIPERHYRHLPRIRRILRFAGVDLRRCVFITDKPIKDPEHLVERFTQLGTRTPALLNEASYPVPPLTSLDGPRLYVLPSERQEVESWLRQQGWWGRELILIQPGNHRTMGPTRRRWRRLNTDDKWWPIERWAGLAHRIHEHKKNAVILLRGSVEEVPMLEEVRVAAHLDSLVVAGQGIRGFLALCTVAHSMISVDTGPAHAAAALGLPLVVLYGVQPSLYWLPRSPSGSPVLGVGGAPEYSRADQVSLDQVFDSWLQLSLHLKRPQASSAWAPQAHPTSAAGKNHAF